MIPCPAFTAQSYMKPFLTLKMTFIYVTKTWTSTQGELAKFMSLICDMVFLLVIIQISIFIVGSTWHIIIPLKRSARPDIMESSENYSICYASLFIFAHRVC